MADSAAQPGFSRAAGRFHFRQFVRSGDSGQVFIQLPNWFSLETRRGGYLGAVNRFGLGALTECVAGIRLGSSANGIRLDGVTGGNSDYREGNFQVGLVRPLNGSLWVGSGLGLSFTQVRGYGTGLAPVGSIFLGGWLGDRMVWGISGENPQTLLTQKSWMGSNPLRVRAGVAYSFSYRLCVYGALEWERVGAAAALIRMSYQLNPDWGVNLGWGWSPDQFLVGLHRSLRSGSVGIGFSQDPVLGPGFSIFSQWDRPTKN